MSVRFALALAAAFGLFTRDAVAEDSARDIVERAIKVRAENPADLDKQKIEVIAMEGKIFNNNMEIPARREIKFNGLSRYRFDNDLLIDGKPVRATMVLLGSTAWQQVAGTPARDQSFDEIDEFKMEIYGRWLALLTPLRDKAVTLVRLTDSTVGDEPVEVVKATVRLRPEAQLSFSKKSGQLLKISYKARENSVDMRKEHVFADYKLIEGLMLPTKLIDLKQQQGQGVVKAAEWTIKGYKFPSKMDDDVFAKPEKK